jgi:hypothetical protein
MNWRVVVPVIFVSTSMLQCTFGFKGFDGEDRLTQADSNSAAPFAITGDSKCPQSIDLTADALLSGVRGTFVGRRLAEPGGGTDAGDGGADSGDAGAPVDAPASIFVRFEPIGDVICYPSYQSGCGNAGAQVKSVARINLATSDNKWRGTITGNVERASDKSGTGGARLPDIRFVAAAVDPALLGYQVATPGRKLYVTGNLSDNGRLSVDVYETGAELPPVLVDTYSL